MTPKQVKYLNLVAKMKYIMIKAKEINEKFEKMIKKDKKVLKIMGIVDEKIIRMIKEIDDFVKRRKEEIRRRQ